MNNNIPSNKPKLDDNQIMWIDMARALQYFAVNRGPKEYSKDIEIIEHVAYILYNLGRELAFKETPSLKEFFETDLTPLELMECYAIWDDNSERAIYLWAIHAWEFNRTEAQIYAKLKYKSNSNGLLTIEEQSQLEQYEKRIADKWDEVNNTAKSFLTSCEIMENTLEVIKKLGI